MRDLEKLKKNPVHTRKITMTTYSVDDDKVLVEGVLRDDRLKQAFGLTSGETRPAGVIHDLTIRILVDGRELRIEEVEVDLDHVPHDDCRETQDSLRALVGRRIEPGFSMWVRNTFGGPRGCAHLNALLLAMASAAVQGLWTHWASSSVSSETVHSWVSESHYLIDTCRPWRKDGPRASKLREAFGRRTT
ncbi:MAG: DUF2889 domain-containing protein [bacterium]